MDLHKVRNLDRVVIYVGVTRYRPDAQSSALRYAYSNTLGDVMIGYARRTGDEIRIAADVTGSAPTTTVLRLSSGAYEVAPASPESPAVRFRKVGKASKGGL